VQSVEQAFALWREGEQIVEHPWYQQRRDDYERAITATLGRLRGHTTVRELLQAYVSDAVDDAFVEAVILCADGKVLDWQRVEDAAYWRRYAALVQAQAAEAAGEGQGDATRWEGRATRETQRGPGVPAWVLILALAVIVAIALLLLLYQPPPPLRNLH
jgi:hypothetical protein